MTMRHARGFSLLELLLTVAIFAMLMIAVFNLLQTFAERELARSTHKYMSTVAKAMDQILDNVDNFNALYDAAVATGGGYQLIADTTAPAPDNITKNFQVSGVWIQASRLLNSQFRELSPLRSQVRILLRVADNTADPNDTPALEVFVVTATPRPDGVVRLAANAAGPAGGYIRTYNAKNAAVMTHAYGSWRVTPSIGLQATPWYTNELVNLLNSDIQGSYLVHYAYHNLEDKTGDYLYRVEDVDNPANPQRNRNTMHGPLNAGGNDIIGADDVNVGNGGVGRAFTTGTTGISDDCAGSVMCVNGTSVVKGAAYVGGNMTVSGNATISDNMNAQAMRVQNALSSTDRTNYGAQNLFVVDGTGNQQDTIVVQNNATLLDGLTADSGTIAGQTDATTVTVPDGGDYVTGTISNTRRITSSTISTNSLRVDHQLRAGVVNNGNVSVTGTTAVIDVTDSDNLVYGGAANPKTLIAPRINLSRMQVNSFGACDSGCGN